MKFHVPGFIVDGSPADAIRQMYHFGAVPDVPPSPPPFDELLEWARGEVYRLIEAERGQHITTLPGKIGEYRQKEAEFERWERAGKPDIPDPADYPLAEAESAEYGISLPQMLTTWGEKAKDWAKISASLAARERRALRALEKAKDEADVVAALAGLELAHSG